MWRLYALGYVDSAFLGLRPWTRASVEHMLEEAGARLEQADTDHDSAADQAQAIYEAVSQQLRTDMEGPCGPHEGAPRLNRCTPWGAASVALRCATAITSDKVS